MNTLLEARRFAEAEVFSLWQKETNGKITGWVPGEAEAIMWAKLFKPFSYNDALAGFTRFYMQNAKGYKPTIPDVRKHLQSTDGQLCNYYYAQNQKTGCYRQFYYPSGVDVEAAMDSTFRKYFADGNWKGYKANEITHDQLFEFRHRKIKALNDAVADIDSEEMAAYVIEEYAVDPRSATAKEIKKAVKELKRKDLNKQVNNMRTPCP
jgi:hypothetical protein